jgi:hypothetical protein
LVVKVRRGALKRTKQLGHRKLEFPVTIRDVDGRKTSLDVHVRLR